MITKESFLYTCLRYLQAFCRPDSPSGKAREAIVEKCTAYVGSTIAEYIDRFAVSPCSTTTSDAVERLCMAYEQAILF